MIADIDLDTDIIGHTMDFIGPIFVVLLTYFLLRAKVDRIHDISNGRLSAAYREIARLRRIIGEAVTKEKSTEQIAHEALQSGAVLAEAQARAEAEAIELRLLEEQND